MGRIGQGNKCVTIYKHIKNIETWQRGIKSTGDSVDKEQSARYNMTLYIGRMIFSE